MSWIFSLSAECGSSRANADRFAKHFYQVSELLSNGLESKCSSEVFQDSEDNWWSRVSPSDISKIGITTPEAAYQMTETGILLYQHLQSAPSFRYALVGVEVDEFRTYTELVTDSDRIALNFSGLVLAEEIWQLMGSPASFRSFRPGYFWKPYEGEIYKPLMASSNLRDKFNKLLSVPK